MKTVERAALTTLALGAFALGTTESSVIGLLPQVAAGLNVPVGTAGQLVTGYAVAVAIGAPLLTGAFERLPRRPVIAATLVVFALGNLVAGLAPAFPP